jgi:predicted nucleotidyltransferase
MVPDTQHIIETIRNKEAYIRDSYFIKHIDLFGSYAKNQQGTNSDIDLLYTTIPNGTMTLARLRSMENYISQLLQIEKVELVSKQSINPLVAKNIENDAISIF